MQYTHTYTPTLVWHRNTFACAVCTHTYTYASTHMQHENISFWQPCSYMYTPSQPTDRLTKVTYDPENKTKYLYQRCVHSQKCFRLKESIRISKIYILPLLIYSPSLCKTQSMALCTRTHMHLLVRAHAFLHL